MLYVISFENGNVCVMLHIFCFFKMFVPMTFLSISDVLTKSTRGYIDEKFGRCLVWLKVYREFNYFKLLNI